MHSHLVLVQCGVWLVQCGAVGVVQRDWWQCVQCGTDLVAVRCGWCSAARLVQCGAVGGSVAVVGAVQHGSRLVRCSVIGGSVCSVARFGGSAVRLVQCSAVGAVRRGWCQCGRGWCSAARFAVGAVQRNWWQCVQCGTIWWQCGAVGGSAARLVQCGVVGAVWHGWCSVAVVGGSAVRLV